MYPYTTIDTAGEVGVVTLDRQIKDTLLIFLVALRSDRADDERAAVATDELMADNG